MSIQQVSCLALKRAEKNLILDGFVVGLLQPGAHEHAVVIVTEGAQQGGGGVGGVVCQGELGNQLPQ